MNRAYCASLQSAVMGATGKQMWRALASEFRLNVLARGTSVELRPQRFWSRPLNDRGCIVSPCQSPCIFSDIPNYQFSELSGRAEQPIVLNFCGKTLLA